MAKIKTTELVEKAVQALADVGLSQKTIRNYKHCFRMVHSYHEDVGEVYFTTELTQKFILGLPQRLKQEQISKKKFSDLRKAASLLCEMYTTGNIKWKRLTWGGKIRGEEYNRLLNSYVIGKEKNLSQKTIQTHRGIITSFLADMERQGYADFAEVKRCDIGVALSRLSVSYSGSMASVLVALRSFFRFLYEKQLLLTDYTSALIVRAATRRTVIRGFSADEMSRVLSVVDRSTAQGRRDYAILMLGMHTGLRGIDVLNMTHESIDWERDTLRIVQSKTKKALELHLEPIVGNAIVDYLLNGRPAKESRHIFLGVKAPFDKLRGVGSINNFLYRYMDKAKVSRLPGERRGFHSFRRSLATDLLEAGIDPATISNILGQANPNSVRSYLSLNQIQLKDCALSMAGFAVSRGDLL